MSPAASKAGLAQGSWIKALSHLQTRMQSLPEADRTGYCLSLASWIISQPTRKVASIYSNHIKTKYAINLKASSDWTLNALRLNSASLQRFFCERRQPWNLYQASLSFASIVRPEKTPKCINSRMLDAAYSLPTPMGQQCARSERIRIGSSAPGIIRSAAAGTLVFHGAGHCPSHWCKWLRRPNFHHSLTSSNRRRKPCDML